MPTQQGHKSPRNAGNDTRCNAGKDNSTMLAMTPVQCRQGCQHNAGKDANTALAGPFKVKLPWNEARYGNEATCNEDEHVNNATYAEVSRLHDGWADVNLQCWS
jgi:hypothetical protein